MKKIYYALPVLLLNISQLFAQCPQTSDISTSLASAHNAAVIRADDAGIINSSAFTSSAEFSSCISTAENSCKSKLAEISDINEEAAISCSQYCNESISENEDISCIPSVSELSVAPCGGASDLITATVSTGVVPEYLHLNSTDLNAPSTPSSYSNITQWSSPSTAGSSRVSRNVNTDLDGNINYISLSCTSNAILNFKCSCNPDIIPPEDTAGSETASPAGGGTFTGGGLWPVSAMTGTSLCPPDKIYVLYITPEGEYGTGCYLLGEFPLSPSFKNSGIANDALARHLGF